MSHTVSHPEQRRHAIAQRGHRANGDQRIHIGRTVPQGFQASAVIHPVQVHYGQGQNKLQQRRNQGILHAVIPVGRGQADHVSHGEIHEDDQADRAADDPLFHFLQGSFRWGCLCLVRFLFAGQGGIIACVLHRLDDGRNDVLAFRLHLHGSRKKVHFRFFHAGNGVRHLLHPGGTGRAGHAGDIEFQFHDSPSISGESANEPRIPDKFIDYSLHL